jgi:hypothetical protein
MIEIPIELPWWPPEPDEPIGAARADELVATLRQVAPPVVDDAEADLRSRRDAGAEIVRNGAPASYIARFAFDNPQVRSLCVGTVYQARVNPGEMNSIQLGRDGVLRWRRE